MTPDEIRVQLFQVGHEQSRAHDVIAGLEVDAERAELLAQSKMDAQFMLATGSVEERKAVAREAALDVRDAAVVARAAYNRARMKAKFLESETMRLMAALKSIQADGA